MRFRLFLEELDNYFYNDKQDMRPKGAGRLPEIPGQDMTIAQDEVMGQITKKTVQHNYVALSLINNGKLIEVEVPLDRFKRDYPNEPKIGDTIRVVFNRDKSLQDYQIVHRS